jgi:hypothetical protein
MAYLSCGVVGAVCSYVEAVGLFVAITLGNMVAPLAVVTAMH